MYIKTVELKNFKNYNNAFLDLGPNLNILIGDNAQGKTNFLEAIYLSALGRGIRSNRDGDLISYSATSAKVFIKTKNQDGSNIIKIYLNRFKKKSIAINNSFASRVGELIGAIRCVLFSPDEMKIIKGGPIERRKFMDIALCQISNKYFYALVKFNKLLQHRNKLLKSFPTKNDLIIWDLQILEVAPIIINMRRQFVDYICKLANSELEIISGGAERLDVFYDGIAGDNEQSIATNYKERIEKSLERDMQYKITTFGLHKDDVIVKINKLDVRMQCSQGQQRSALLALKLAEVALIKLQTKEYPVVLLDDVLSELDTKRRLALMNRVNNFQTIMTCTDISDDLSLYQYKKFYVKNGTITKEKS